MRFIKCPIKESKFVVHQYIDASKVNGIEVQRDYKFGADCFHVVLSFDYNDKPRTFSFAKEHEAQGFINEIIN